jgi:SAM-dependent MidA family methyltransferase
MTEALYGVDGFFTRPGPGPAAHFRTSVHRSPLLAQAVSRLLTDVDRALDWPPQLAVVDVGAGRGELLTGLLNAVPPDLGARIALTAVELAPRPAGLDDRIRWCSDLPQAVEGLVIATEWLDNVPVDVVEVDPHGEPRYVLVDDTGAETLGDAVTGADADWLGRWWALDGSPSGARAEVGIPRDEAWRGAVASLRRGLAVAVDYGHTAGQRPVAGTLTGFRYGRQIPPVPDGSRDLTAHVAIDAVRAAGAGVCDHPAALTTQRMALRELGVDGARPPLALATSDPAAYVRALAASSAAAELIDPAGLGAHWWLSQPVGVTIRHT